MRLYERYLVWADYRRYRWFFDRHPERGDKQAAPPPSSPVPADEGPRYFHDAHLDVWRFLQARREGREVAPLYTVWEPVFHTAADALQALEERINAIRGNSLYGRRRHNDATDNARRNVLAAQVDALTA